MKIIMKYASKTYTDGGYKMECQKFEINAEEAKQMWINFDLPEADDLTEEEIRKELQEKVNAEFNRPERNNQDRNDYKTDFYFGLTNESDSDGVELIADQHSPKMLQQEAEFNEACQLIRSALPKKPEWAEIVINHVLLDETFVSIGKRTEQSEASVRAKFNRATEKLRKVFQNSSNFRAQIRM